VRNKVGKVSLCIKKYARINGLLNMGSYGAGMPPAPAAVGGVRRFVDISVPRNVAADINELEGAARVFNVDDLKQVRGAAEGTCAGCLRSEFGEYGGVCWGLAQSAKAYCLGRPVTAGD
jgi:hypothetical protein